MMKRYILGIIGVLMGTLSVFAQDTVLNDGRLDRRADAPIVLYCRFDNGLEGYIATGGVSFEVSRRQIESTLARSAVERATLPVVFGAGGAQLTAYADNSLVLSAPNGGSTYLFRIPALACGGYTPDYTNAVTVLVGAVDGLLNLPTAGGTTTSVTPATTTSSTVSNTVIVSGSTLTHTVRQGENLFRIGLRYGVPYAEIARVNGLGNANSIFVGQVLVIPQ